MRKRRFQLVRARNVLECESGAALVEMTVILPVLLILFVGGVEFGRALTYHHAIEKAARDTGRYLARLPDPLAFDQVRAKNYFLYGSFTSPLSDPAPTQPITTPGRLDRFLVERVTRLTRTNVIVQADVKYTFDFLPFVGLGPELTFKVNYEQPLIEE
jgi:Flp pilus assembly protein TadG